MPLRAGNDFMTKDVRFAVVVPAYREGGRIGAVVKAIRVHAPMVVVVDDGSPDGTAAEAEEAGAHVIRHPRNQGKGAALETGFAFAAQQGLEFVITLDADRAARSRAYTAVCGAAPGAGCPGDCGESHGRSAHDAVAEAVHETG